MVAQTDPATIAGYFQPEGKRINLGGHAYPLPFGVETMSPLLRAARIPSRGYILALLLGAALGTLCALFI